MIFVRPRIGSLAAGIALDLAFGDPPWAPHPVRGFGWMAARLERLWRRAEPLCGERLAGAGFWLTAVGLAGAFVRVSLTGSDGWRKRGMEIYWIYSLLAIRDLDRQATSAVIALRKGDLALARRQTARIVGRDAANLDETEILRAASETVAENLGDAVVAPLVYWALGGPVLMAAYKAANTLDSMVGYRNERYLRFGWFSARADDALNIIPARLAAVSLVLAALLLRLDARGAMDAVVRDARRQPSPNAGYPEAAYAGALGVRLGGVNFYGGRPKRKEFLGRPRRPLSASVFADGRRLFYCGAFLAGCAAAAWVGFREGRR